MSHEHKQYQPVRAQGLPKGADHRTPLWGSPPVFAGEFGKRGGLVRGGRARRDDTSPATITIVCFGVQMDAGLLGWLGFYRLIVAEGRRARESSRKHADGQTDCLHAPVQAVPSVLLVSQTPPNHNHRVSFSRTRLRTRFRSSRGMVMAWVVVRGRSKKRNRKKKKKGQDGTYTVVVGATAAAS